MPHDAVPSPKTSPSSGGHTEVEYRITATPPAGHSLVLSPTEPIAEPTQVTDMTPENKQPSTAEVPATTAPPPAAANKILFLDGLRGLAAMMVVVQHGHWMRDSHVGQPAVDTFFVLSAFLLTMIFEKKARTLIQQRASPKRWMWALLDYFVRRFLRVYPLFFVIAWIIFILPDSQKEIYFVFSHPDKYNLWKVLIFSFDYRYHVFWTLPLEIMYYFMIPPLVVFILVLRKFWLLPVLPLAYWVVYSGFHWNRSNHQPLRLHLPTFICGSLAAIVYAKMDQWITKRQFVFKWWSKGILRAIELFFLAILFSVQFNGLFFDWVMENPVAQTPGERFVAANVSIVIICELLLPGAVSSVLEWSLLRYAGKVSYSMYMLHSFVVYNPSVDNQKKYWNRYWAIWMLVFALSALSYHVVEYPCQWFAGRVGKAIKKRDAAQIQREREREVPALPILGDAAAGSAPAHTHTA